MFIYLCVIYKIKLFDGTVMGAFFLLIAVQARFT